MALTRFVSSHVCPYVKIEQRSDFFFFSFTSCMLFTRAEQFPDLLSSCSLNLTFNRPRGKGVWNLGHESWRGEAGEGLTSSSAHPFKGKNCFKYDSCPQPKKNSVPSSHSWLMVTLSTGHSRQETSRDCLLLTFPHFRLLWWFPIPLLTMANPLQHPSSDKLRLGWSTWAVPFISKPD